MSVAEAIFGRLADGELVIIDGGMGSQLQAEGVPMDHVAWSARANLEQPHVVQRVHEEYIRAGAEVLIANSYAASRAALEPAGLGSRVAEANRSAVRAALRAREAAATGPVAVAGSMSSFCPNDMEPGGLGRPHSRPTAEDSRLPSPSGCRAQSTSSRRSPGPIMVRSSSADAAASGRTTSARSPTAWPCDYLFMRASPFAADAAGPLGLLSRRDDGQKAADQLRATRGYGRADAGGNGAMPAGGHSASGELRGAGPRSGGLLGFRQIMAGNHSRRGLAPRHP